MSIWDWIRTLAVTIGPVVGTVVFLALRSWGVDPLFAFGFVGIAYTLAAAGVIWGGLWLFDRIDGSGDDDTPTTITVEV